MQQQFFDINPIDKEFRNGLSNFREQPRKRVWYRISNILDQQTIRRVGRRKLFFVISAVVVTAITVTAVLIPESIKTITKDKIKNEVAFSASSVKQQSQESNNTFGNNITLVSRQQLETLNSNIKSTVKYLDGILNKVNRAEAGEMDKIARHPFTWLKEKEPGTKEITLKHSQPKQERITSQKYHTKKSGITDLKLPVSNSLCIKGFYVGAGSAINFTKLIDEKAKNNDNFHYFFTTGTAYTVKAGYNFSERVGVEAGWNIKSTEGQKYNFIPYTVARLDADQMKNKITLNYTQVPVTVKYKFSKISNVTQSPVVLNVETGVQYGYLKSVTKTFQSSLTQNDKFRKSEVAAVAGIGYDIYFGKNIALNLGTRVTYGTNIFQSPVSEYNEFSAPHNLTAGINAGLTYLIPGCR